MADIQRDSLTRHFLFSDYWRPDSLAASFPTRSSPFLFPLYSPRHAKCSGDRSLWVDFWVFDLIQADARRIPPFTVTFLLNVLEKDPSNLKSRDVDTLFLFPRLDGFVRSCAQLSFFDTPPFFGCSFVPSVFRIAGTVLLKGYAVFNESSRSSSRRWRLEARHFLSRGSSFPT